MKKFKSPIKSKALRNPGQSVEETIHDLIYDKIFTYYMSAIILVIYAGLEWIYWYQQTPRHPWVFTIFAILAILLAVYKFFRIRKVIKNHRQGLDGERAVGQYLDKLRKDGFEVFHDIIFDGFNIDHVVISKNGIFCIETKTYSKPVKGESKLYYDGGILEVNGFKTTAPIIQAKAASISLQELLEQSTGKKYSIKPVLLFPGWYVEPKTKEAQLDVWALNPKGFQTFAKNQNKSLNDEEVNLVSYHLSRHVRSL